MRALLAGLALCYVLLQAELSSAQIGVEKCNLVAQKEFEYVTAPKWPNLCMCDEIPTDSCGIPRQRRSYKAPFSHNLSSASVGLLKVVLRRDNVALVPDGLGSALGSSLNTPNYISMSICRVTRLIHLFLSV